MGEKTTSTLTKYAVLRITYCFVKLFNMCNKVEPKFCIVKINYISSLRYIFC